MQDSSHDYKPRTRDGMSSNNSTAQPSPGPAVASGGGGGGGGTLANFYAHQFPSAEELQLSLADNLATVDDMREVVAELRRQVDVLAEETRVITKHAETLRHHRLGGVGAGAGAAGPGGGNESTPTFVQQGGEGGDEPAVSHHRTGSGMDDSLDSDSSDRLAADLLRKRGGQNSSSSSGTNFRSGKSGPKLTTESEMVLIEDKLTLMHKEGERLRQQEEKAFRESEEIRDLLMATVEEASRRMKELSLEIIKFNREVIDEESGTASGNLLQLYMERRAAAQKSYLDKLLGQCQATEEDIARAQQQLRTRRAAGEAFHAIDFEQLRIENQQFNERIDKKNQELVELKGTSTRTVQTLNMLMDALNDMTNEQAQLKKEYKSRCDYLSRCSKEVTVVSKEAGKAEGKHQALRAQHEAVKVPKIEEYIAQKAELFELEKACKNWQRKVEIAEGQRQVLRQQLQRMRRQRDAAIEYSENKKKRLQENLGKCPTKLPAINPQPTSPKPPAGAVPAGFEPLESSQARNPPGGGGTRKASKKKTTTATSSTANSKLNSERASPEGGTHSPSHSSPLPQESVPAAEASSHSGSGVPVDNSGGAGDGEEGEA